MKAEIFISIEKRKKKKFGKSGTNNPWICKIFSKVLVKSVINDLINDR